MSRVRLPPAEPMKISRLAEIARGGMGSVELARVDEGRLEGQIIAVKRLHSNIASDPQFVSMFLDEAWLTAALHHPNVVAVVAWGDDDRGMFLAIEFVQGVSLARLLKESRQNHEMFAERTVANLCSQICAGLTAAHGLQGEGGALLGLVHRDLTPGNVLVRFDGLVKIVDFGIAKAEERISHTRTGTLKGKPSYMAPEQARGGKVDQRADIFSFGVLMFELLAGRRPWKAKAAFDVMMEIATEPPPRLAELRPALNPEFIAIVEKCLEKKPEDRFASAAEIQVRLDAWRAQKGFVSDDQQSLAAFVVRNSAAQIAWYEAAMRGDLVKADKAESFKELEEKIDAQRAEADRPKMSATLRPAAGQAPTSGARPAGGELGAPPRNLSPTPFASPARSTSGPPAEAPRNLSPAPFLSPARSEAPVSSQPSVGNSGASPASASQSPRRLAGAGTEYMAISPFASGEPRLPKSTPPPSSGPRGFSPTGPAAPTPSNPPRGFGSGVYATPSAGFGASSPASSESRASPSSRPTRPPAAAPRRSSAGIIIVVLLAVALMGIVGILAAQVLAQRRAPLPPAGAPASTPPAPAGT